MIGILIVNEAHISIQYDIVEDILYVDWKGDQDKASVMDGCEKILHHLSQYRCKRVLNDNTNVTSIWDDASEWVGADWFPRMHSAGCKLFAWVYSPNLFSKLSADKAIEHCVGGVIVTTFDSTDNAGAWLRVMPV